MSQYTDIELKSQAFLKNYIKKLKNVTVNQTAVTFFNSSQKTTQKSRLAFYLLI